MPSQSVENYLKALFHLQHDTPGESVEAVQTKQIAEHLDLSLPSVSSMVQTLSEQDLVNYEPYKGAKLSDKGRKEALKVVRNHRLIEVFLVQVLGYTWDEVHAEAERLEHAVSQKFVSRIDEFLAYPKLDPHGDPIPTPEGEIEQPDWKPLADAEQGARLKIERVLDQEPELLRYFEKLNLTLESEIEVENILQFDGQMHLQVDGREVTISRLLASKLLVSRVD